MTASFCTYFRKRVGGEVVSGQEEAGLRDTSQRLQHILHLASSSGEHEKLAQVRERLHVVMPSTSTRHRAELVEM